VSRLLARLGGAVPAPARPSFPTVEEIAARFERSAARAPVGWSADLGRVLALPRRDLETAYSAADVAALEARLRGPGPCTCAKASPPRPCPLRFRPIQAWALLEAARAGGLLAPMGVGHGKELVCLLLPVVMGAKTAVLMTQGNLRSQLLERDWNYYGGHWRLPNLAGGK
jgi:hypothetical protein